jgi:hypothetical protein
MKGFAMTDSDLGLPEDTETPPSDYQTEASLAHAEHMSAALVHHLTGAYAVAAQLAAQRTEQHPDAPNPMRELRDTLRVMRDGFLDGKIVALDTRHPDQGFRLGDLAEARLTDDGPWQPVMIVRRGGHDIFGNAVFWVQSTDGKSHAVNVLSLRPAQGHVPPMSETGARSWQTGEAAFLRVSETESLLVTIIGPLPFLEEGGELDFYVEDVAGRRRQVKESELRKTQPIPHPSTPKGDAENGPEPLREGEHVRAEFPGGRVIVGTVTSTVKSGPGTVVITGSNGVAHLVPRSVVTLLERTDGRH